MMPEGLDLIWTLAPLVVQFTPLSCFMTHILSTDTVFLIKLHTCECMFHSLSVCNSAHRCPRDRLYVLSYPRTSNRTHFSRHIHYRIVQLQDAAWLYILFMMKWIFFDYDFSFKICCSSWKYMSSSSRTDPSFFPRSGNKLQHKPCPPYISWMPSRSPLYLTHPGPNLNYFYYNWKTLSKSILELGQRKRNDHRICPTWKIDMQHLESAVWATASSSAWGGHSQLWAQALGALWGC